MSELSATDAHVPGPAASALARVLEQYLADVQAGTAPDRTALLAAHPELASELEQCLAGLDFIQRASHQPAGVPVQLGDFRILREVGRGGMGVVYEAVQLSLDRRVALKVLRFGSSSDPEALARFRREAQTVAGLHHTHIVPLFASGCENGIHYFAMQFVEGEGLHLVLERRLGEGRRPDATEIASWGLQAAEALAYAHQRGVIHRDVKPSNLLLDGQGNLWLTDFGLARRTEESALTVTGALMGTPRYMSPEQARATPLAIDHRTDIYSLGATLYELVAGRPACDATSPQEVLDQIVNTEPPALSQFRQDLPRDLETIINKCLAKEPARRYATAGDLADDLRAFLDGRPIKARRPRLIERALRWVKQRRRGVASSGSTALALGLLSAACLLLWGWYQEWRQGSLVLTTDGPTLEAIVLEEGRDRELARFKVPSLEPIKLPEGVYRVRLEEPGSLSETYNVLVERGVQTTYKVALQHRRVGTPIREAALWPLDDVPTPEGKRRDEMLEETKDGLRRFRVDTGATVWEASLDPEFQPALAGARHYDWRAMLHGPPGEQRVRYEQGDLDGDGVTDAVWASKSPAGVLAVSGATGRVLWWRDVPRRGHWSSPLALSLADVFRKGWTGKASAASWIAPPRVTDLDGDGTKDVVAGFSYQDKDQLDGVCLAIRGATGEVLWSRDRVLDLYSPLELTLDGKPTLLVGTGRFLRWLDRRTGEPLRPDTNVGFVPRRPPLLLESPHGEPVVLLVRKAERPPVPHQRWVDFDLVALSPSRPETPLWVEPFQAPANAWNSNAWPHVAKFDGGAEEVVVPAAWRGQGKPYRASEDADRYRWWSGLRVLGRDGKERWRRGLWLQGLRLCEPPNEVHVGPDIDGDGLRDLFLVSTGGHPGGQGVMAEALSGADGRTLWWWRQPLPTFIFSTILGIVSPWKTGDDGHPLLAMQLMGSGGRPVIGVFKASTGRLVHTLPETGYLFYHGNDLAGNGLPALGYINEERGNGFLEWVQGTSVERWRWLGRWQPVHDLNGDGVADLVESSRWQMLALSGKDGALIWKPRPLPDVYPFSEFRRFGAADWKFDDDGVGDVLTAGPVGDGRFPLHLHAHSGSTGEPLWRSPDLRPDGSALDRDVLAVECGDWLQEGRPQILVVTTTEVEGGKELLLHLLGGGDGGIRWQQAHGVTGPDPRTFPFQVVRPGQGPPVLVTMFQERGQGAFIQGQDLATGARVWRHPLSTPQPGGLVPLLTVARGGQGQQVTLVSLGKRLLALDPADGGLLWEWADSDGYAQQPLVLSSEAGVWVVNHQETPTGQWLGTRPPDRPARLLLLDAEGKEVRRLTLPAERNHGAGETIRAHDTDGDGTPEILFVSPRRARLISPHDGRELWEVEFPTRKGELRQLLGEVAVFQEGETVLGVELATKRVRWRCHGPGRWQGLLPGPNGEPPGVVYRADEDASGTVCRDARAVDSSEAWLPLPTKPLPGPPPPDPRRSRDLPSTHRDFLFFYAINALWALVVVAGPALWLLGWWRWRGWPWLAGLAGYLGLVVLAFSTGLISDEVSWQQLAMAEWFRGFYTDWMGRPPIKLCLLRIVAGLPLVAFVGMAGWWLAQRRWGMLALLLGLSLAVAPIRSSIDLAQDMAHTEPEEYYVWSQYWRYWFHGVHDVGLGLPLLLLLIAAVRRFRRRKPLPKE